MSPTLLQRILGVNAKVRSLALALALSYTILRWPALLAGIPDDIKGKIFGAAHDFLEYGIFLALWFLKQSNVTGNGTLESPAKVAQSDGGNKVVSILLALLLPALAFAGCAWLENPDNQTKLKQTGFWVLKKAGQIALNTVASQAISSSDASVKADWLDSLATATRADISSDDLRSLIGIWTPDKSHWQDLGAQLTDLAKQAATLPPEQRNEAIAKALNNVAAQLRTQAASPTQVWHVPRGTESDLFPLPTLYSAAGEPIRPTFRNEPLVITREP